MQDGVRILERLQEPIALSTWTHQNRTTLSNRIKMRYGSNTEVSNLKKKRERMSGTKYESQASLFTIIMLLKLSNRATS